MNPRERRLALIVGVVLGIGALYQGVNYFYLGAIADAEAEYDQLVSERKELTELIESEDELALKWNGFVERTLATSPQLAQERLGERLKAIATEHGFHDAQFDKKNSVFKIGSKTDIVAVGFRITTKGDFVRVVDFLRAIYRAPFISVVSNLTLTPLDSRSTANRDLVVVEFSVDTPVLPEIKLNDIPLASRAKPLLPAELETLPPFRRERLNDSYYAVLADRNVFKAFIPAPTNVVTIDNQDRKSVVVKARFLWEGKETEQLPKSVAGTNREPIQGEGDEVEITGSYSDGTKFGPAILKFTAGKELVYPVPSHTPPEPDTVILAVNNQHDKAISMTLSYTAEDDEQKSLPPMTIEAGATADLGQWKAKEVKLVAKYPSDKLAKEETFRPGMELQTCVIPQEQEIVVDAGAKDPDPDPRFSVTGLWIRPDVHEIIVTDGTEHVAHSTQDDGAIDGGTLFAAVPGLGGIVRIPTTGHYYMYPLGGKFTQRVLLDAEDESQLPAAIDAWTHKPGPSLTTSEEPATEGEKVDQVSAAAPSEP